MFRIEETKIGKTEAVRMLNDVSGEYVEILNGFGAGLNDMVIRNGRGELMSIIDGYRSEEELIKDRGMFKGSKLSPFPNRTKEGKMLHEGVEYQLPVNEVAANNSLHGILYDSAFEIVEKKCDAEKAILVLTFHYEAFTKGFPFDYKTTIQFTFNSDGLIVSTEVKNCSDLNISMGDGWHPYFKFGSSIDKLGLRLGKAKKMNSITGNTAENEFVKIDGLEFDDCFEIDAQERLNVVIDDPENQFQLQIYQDDKLTKYPYFQIYTPPSRDSIAIEPVSCPPNAAQTEDNLVHLSPSEKATWQFGVRAVTSIENQ